MYLRARLTIAALFGIYGLAVMLAMALSAVNLDTQAFGNLFSISLYVLVAASLAGYITAPLFGHYHVGGVAVSLFGAVVTTGIAVSLAVIFITGPALVAGAFASGAFLTAAKAVLVGIVLSVMAVVEGIYTDGIVLALWLIGMIATHSLARVIRRKSDLRPFNS